MKRLFALVAFLFGISIARADNLLSVTNLGASNISCFVQSISAELLNTNGGDLIITNVAAVGTNNFGTTFSSALNLYTNVAAQYGSYSVQIPVMPGSNYFINFSATDTNGTVYASNSQFQASICPSGLLTVVTLGASNITSSTFDLWGNITGTNADGLIITNIVAWGSIDFGTNFGQALFAFTNTTTQFGKWKTNVTGAAVNHAYWVNFESFDAMTKAFGNTVPFRTKQTGVQTVYGPGNMVSVTDTNAGGTNAPTHIVLPPNSSIFITDTGTLGTGGGGPGGGLSNATLLMLSLGDASALVSNVPYTNLAAVAAHGPRPGDLGGSVLTNSGTFSVSFNPLLTSQTLPLGGLAIGGDDKTNYVGIYFDSAGEAYLQTNNARILSSENSDFLVTTIFNQTGAFTNNFRTLPTVLFGPSTNSDMPQIRAGAVHNAGTTSTWLPNAGGGFTDPSTIGGAGAGIATNLAYWSVNDFNPNPTNQLAAFVRALAAANAGSNGIRTVYIPTGTYTWHTNSPADYQVNAMYWLFSWCTNVTVTWGPGVFINTPDPNNALNAGICALAFWNCKHVTLDSPSPITFEGVQCWPQTSAVAQVNCISYGGNMGDSPGSSSDIFIRNVRMLHYHHGVTEPNPGAHAIDTTFEDCYADYIGNATLQDGHAYAGGGVRLKLIRCSTGSHISQAAFEVWDETPSSGGPDTSNGVTRDVLIDGCYIGGAGHEGIRALGGTGSLIGDGLTIVNTTLENTNDSSGAAIRIVGFNNVTMGHDRIICTNPASRWDWGVQYQQIGGNIDMSDVLIEGTRYGAGAIDLVTSNGASVVFNNFRVRLCGIGYLFDSSNTNGAEFVLNSCQAVSNGYGVQVQSPSVVRIAGAGGSYCNNGTGVVVTSGTMNIETNNTVVRNNTLDILGSYNSYPSATATPPTNQALQNLVVNGSVNYAAYVLDMSATNVDASAAIGNSSGTNMVIQLANVQSGGGTITWNANNGLVGNEYVVINSNLYWAVTLSNKVSSGKVACFSTSGTNVTTLPAFTRNILRRANTTLGAIEWLHTIQPLGMDTNRYVLLAGSNVTLATNALPTLGAYGTQTLSAVASGGGTTNLIYNPIVKVNCDEDGGVPVTTGACNGSLWLITNAIVASSNVFVVPDASTVLGGTMRIVNLTTNNVNLISADSGNDRLLTNGVAVIIDPAAAGSYTVYPTQEMELQAVDNNLWIMPVVERKSGGIL